MELIEWNEKFSVGIEEIDDQHKRLFQIINNLFIGMTERCPVESVEEALDEMVKYTKYHFETEERYFEKCNYPHAEEHRERHRELITQISDLKDRVSDSAPCLSMELLDLLTEWIQKHILIHDQKYTAFLHKD